MDQLLVLLLLLAVVVLYITRWLPLAATSLLVPPVLYLGGVLDGREALAGFANAATVTIACMFVLSAGLARTGALVGLTAFLKRHAKGSPLRLLGLLALTVPLVSAVMNNIPVVAMLLPVVLALARDMGVKPSRLLIPMSFFAILGGTTTLIGTGTNILVDDFYRGWQQAHGLAGTGFGMFEFAPLGLVLLAAGAAFLLLLGRRFLPERESLSSLLPLERSAQFLTEILIDEDATLVGQRVGDLLEPEENVRLLEFVRRERVLLGRMAHDLVLEPGDTMLLAGRPKETAEFLERTHAKVSTGEEDSALPPSRTAEMLMGEAVVLPESPFVGRRVGGLALNRRFGVKVIAIQRGGLHTSPNVRDIVLKPGDVLLVQASEHGFASLRDTEAVLLVEGIDQTLHRRGHTPIAVAIVLGVVGLGALTPVPIVVWAVLGAALMIATRCLRVDEATRSLDVPVLLLLVGTIPLGMALEKTGLARDLVTLLLDRLGHLHPAIILSALYLLTSVVTEFISNKATAILVAPIAIELALRLGVSERPFLFAVCFAASASFMTPFGYPTNLIVMGPGGYRFTDYLRVGVPLNLIVWLLASLLIPVLWPF